MVVAWEGMTAQGCWCKGTMFQLGRESKFWRHKVQHAEYRQQYRIVYLNLLREQLPHTQNGTYVNILLISLIPVNNLTMHTYIKTSGG